MPKSVSSYYEASHTGDGQDEDDLGRDPYQASGIATPPSPTYTRHPRSRTSSAADLHSRVPSRFFVDERSSLLGNRDPQYSSYMSVPHSGAATPRPHTLRHNSHSHVAASVRIPKIQHVGESFSARLLNALSSEHRHASDSAEQEDKPSTWRDDRVWYDQFTSTDWVHDSIADAYRLKALRSRRDFRGRLAAWLDGAQGWILVAIIGCLTACMAYFVNVTERVLFDYKEGYCSTGWYLSRKGCCSGVTECEEWNRWSDVFGFVSWENTSVEFAGFCVAVIILACLACVLTLTTKTVIPSAVSISTLDENLGAEIRRLDRDERGRKSSLSPTEMIAKRQHRPPMVYCSAAGSGVAEVKVILSGFVLHGYLGIKTLTVKMIALILSVASGLSLGKEGPYVHIATCIGNIACRLFSKYNHNDAKRREVLSASAASGVAVAFGAPIGGVLFSLEEVSYYFPPKTLFRTFFCCIAAALTLAFLNPYGTRKIVLFEVRYHADWQVFEMVAFVILGILGGLLGALFIKASSLWARTFRRIPSIKKHPMLEVFLVALITGIISFWNRYTKLPVTELLYELAKECDTFTDSGIGLCPTMEQIPNVIWYLTIAFVIKAFLTTITFGIKVPAGIYVPSMVVGGLLGRIVGHTVQWIGLNYSHTGLFGTCDPANSPERCVIPGVYALVAAGATMTGVTRLTVTLAVILFELTGSLDHVLPFSIAILVSKWTADAIEPLSIYDLLTDMNSYPFLDNKLRPVFTAELGDITPPVREERIIDISESPLTPARELREKLKRLHMLGELDGGLPIVKDGILVGLIPAPDLEFALDKLENETKSLCLMSPQVGWNIQDDDPNAEQDPTDFTPYIDPAPLSLDINSPLDLVYECFVKLGLRYVCVLRDGQYAGLIHKKTFVKYVKDVEENERH